MTTLVTMTEQFASRLSSFANTAAGRIANNAFWRGTTEIMPLTLAADAATLETLEAAPQQPPVANNLAQFNFDLSEFEGVGADVHHTRTQELAPVLQPHYHRRPPT